MEKSIEPIGEIPLTEKEFAEKAANAIKQALSGLGTDEGPIIEILKDVKKTNTGYMLLYSYERLFNKSLLRELEEEFPGGESKKYLPGFLILDDSHKYLKKDGIKRI